MAHTAGAVPIRLLLVDDHRIVREGVRALLEREPDLCVVAEAGPGPDAVAVALREQPAIIVLEPGSGADDALQIIPALISAAPVVRVLLLTAVQNPDEHRRAIRLGASGVVSKTEPAETVIKAVRRIHAGEVWLDRSMTAVVLREMLNASMSPARSPEANRIALLTARERDIVKLVAQGHGTQKIAASLLISHKTVRNHLASIYEKLNVSERLELGLYAVKHGLLSESQGNPES